MLPSLDSPDTRSRNALARASARVTAMPCDLAGPCWNCKMSRPCVYVVNVGRLCADCYERREIDGGRNVLASSGDRW